MLRTLTLTLSVLTMMHVASVPLTNLALIAPCHATGPSPQPSPLLQAQRIVSIGSDVTEFLAALGAGDRIVAVDTTSRVPPDVVRGKPDVGYMRALSAEGVLALAPTHIIASAGAGPAEAVRALKAASIAFVEVPSEPTALGTLAKIAVIGNATGRITEAEALARSITEAYDRLDERRRGIAAPRRVLFILNASGGRTIVGGHGTSADAALALAGASNAASRLEGYKPVTDEGLIAMAPDAVIVMQGGREGAGPDEIARAAWVRSTPAGSGAEPRVTGVDGSALLSFGPRTPAVVGDLMTWLYPEPAKAGKS
ncbi:MAG: ABC transporter substrate-binding protein [Hyphomicrobiaceae bacterium]|nr:ABC transporter substrate-binding protein [Hyphomicrobiaceae bacterium]